MLRNKTSVSKQIKKQGKYEETIPMQGFNRNR